MSDRDLIDLYSPRILALAASIPHQTRLEAPEASVKKRAPLCGSTVTVDLSLENGRVSAFGQDVKACALGQAAASVVGQVIVGRDRNEIAQAYQELKTFLEGGSDAPAPPFDGLEVLRPAAAFKNRHGSILLCLEATLDAFDSASKSDAAE